MCIIAISDKGIRQPNTNEIKAMFLKNPDGAGYMYLKNGYVYIRKGFMDVKSFLAEMAKMNFTDDDVVVYHFRISTQGGISPAMCQPFGFTSDIVKTQTLKLKTKLGIAHNGVIRMTTYSDPTFSDTAHFISEYLPLIIQSPDDINNPYIEDIIENLIGSKMVLLNGNGDMSIIGKGWITEKSGIIYSNSTYKFTETYVRNSVKRYFSILDLQDDM